MKVVSDENFTIALDITVSESLRMEGISRDFINKVQNIRKDLGFEVTDKIKFHFYSKDKLFKDSIKNNLNFVCNEIQAKEIKFLNNVNNSNKLQIDDKIIFYKILKTS